MIVFSKKVQAQAGAFSLVIILFEALRRAFTRGAHDFAVFHHAWHLVWTGQGSQVYRDSPDRFLYSPGFAWFLAPLGGLSQQWALVLWCFLKVIALLWVAKWVASEALKKVSVAEEFDDFTRWRAVILSMALGVLIISRPLLIDFEYGQVNVLILALAIWGLATHLDAKSSGLKTMASWFLLGIIALAKVFPLPLLLIPFCLPLENSREKLRVERQSVLAAVFFTGLAPLLSLGWAGAWRLIFDWRDALLARGFPIESHNQSFLAFVQHFLSGHPTPVISENGRAFFFGAACLSSDQIFLISLCWTLAALGVTLAWVIRGPKEKADSLRWAVLLVGLLIIPSHLIWKPYFVLSLPLAVYVASQALTQRRRAWRWVFFLFLFFGMNLTTFDVLGHHWGALLEASSSLLILHLALMFWVAWV